MNEDVLNTSVRKFLKTVGVSSQREIEKAVRDAVANGRLKGNEKLARQNDADRRRHQSVVRNRRRGRARIATAAMRNFRWSLLTLLALLATAPAVAGAGSRWRGQSRRRSRAAEARSRGPGVLRLLPPDAVSEKEITLGGRTIAYTATAGTLSLFDQSGERSAAVFYTAYVAKGAADAARRPGHLRVQRRAGRGIGLSQSRPRRARASSISARMAATARRPSSSTTRTAGSPSPIW